ncbi:uncharacterized protein LOC135473478 [Liolophura sinensis]|uniref:uncharacterized protein LOC135473478 n=1 Tax=Liolophura sinensis TaxID=3198878 RepID=UPI00315880D0
MAALLLLALASVISMGYCDNYTVTKEAWFDIEIRDYDGPGEDYRGRFVIGLFGETTPMTVMNFASITNGFERTTKEGYKQKLTYKSSNFHRVVPDFVIQGGDITSGDGSGGQSIYGSKFVDENFILSHKAAGYVSMANHGQDTNGSQFFIMLTKARWLDNKHVVFGKVVKGMDTIRAIGDVKTDNFATPKNRVKVIDCGCEDVKKYTLTEAETLSEEDVDRD